MAELRGYLRFKVICAAPERFINKLHESTIPITKLRLHKNIVYGDIHWYDQSKLLGLAEKEHAQVEIIRRHGAAIKILRYKRRFGLAAGLILSAVMLFYLSNIVLKIEVYGSETMSERELIGIMNDHGIYTGRFIPSINLRRAEEDILADADKLEWFSLRASGCRIVAEACDITEKPEMIATNVPCNIISAKDAQIIDVNVRMGMLVPMLYDGVRKGELLISGTVDGKLDRDYYVHAMGEIVGRYDERVSFFQPYEEEIRSYSDEFTRKSLYFFGLRVPLYIKRNIEYEYDYSETVNFAELLDMRLPVGIIISEYKPYRAEIMTCDKTQAEFLVNDKIDRYEKNFLDGENVKIVGREIALTETENGLYASVTYTLEGNIGVEKEIFAK